MFGDLRDSFIEQADASRRERADAEARHHEEIILPFRRTNPGGNVELPSFAEMVEESYRAKLNVYETEDINTLLWTRVFKAWGRNGKDFSPEQFCTLIEDNNKGKEGKAGLSNNTIYNWRNHPDKYKCIAVSVKVMSKAFGYAHNNYNNIISDYSHELMLWQIIDGRLFKNPYPADASRDGTAWSPNVGITPPYVHEARNALDAAIDAAQAASDHGALVRELIDASGISMSRLQTLVGCQQLHQWCKSANIEDVSMAKRFLNIVHPPALQAYPARAKKQNRRMLGLLTGRLLDLPAIMQEVQKEGIENPGGQLLVLLTGRKGLVTIPADDLAEALRDKGHDVSVDKVKKMRSSSRQRGGGITEPLARSILAIVQEKAGIAVEPEQYDSILDIFTNCQSPSKLLARCVKGELAIGEMVRMSYERKDMTQAEFQDRVQIAQTSDFLLGKSHLENGSARNIADWLGFKKEERRQFIVLATGHKASLNTMAILNEVLAGTKLRVEGLRMIYDASGMTRVELAEASGVDISYSVKKISQGRLSASPGDMRILSGLCGLKWHDDDFIHAFSTGWVARSTKGTLSSAIGPVMRSEAASR